MSAFRTIRSPIAKQRLKLTAPKCARRPRPSELEVVLSARRPASPASTVGSTSLRGGCCCAATVFCGALSGLSTELCVCAIDVLRDGAKAADRGALSTLLTELRAGQSSSLVTEQRPSTAEHSPCFRHNWERAQSASSAAPQE